MNRYFSGLCLTGFCLSWLLAFTNAYPQDRRKQQPPPQHHTDTLSDTRLLKNNMPPPAPTDTLPMPQSAPPVPIPPDSLPGR